MLFHPAVSAAADLKIVDSMGLTRAMKVIDETANVVVRVKKGQESTVGDQSLTLTHVDGIAPDVSGNKRDGGRYEFVGVLPGTWLVKAPDGIIIAEVKIK